MADKSGKCHKTKFIYYFGIYSQNYHRPNRAKRHYVEPLLVWVDKYTDKSRLQTKRDSASTV